MATIVAKTGIKREKGWLYYLDKKGDVSRARMARGGGKVPRGKKNEKVEKCGIEREEGFLYFIGRRDEMIKTSGYRVSPTEVEEAAYATGMIGECAAFGVDDAALGQAIVLIAKPVGEGELDRQHRPPGVAEQVGDGRTRGVEHGGQFCHEPVWHPQRPIVGTVGTPAAQLVVEDHRTIGRQRREWLQ